MKLMLAVVSMTALAFQTGCFHKLQARSMSDHTGVPTVSVTTTVQNLAQLPRCDQGTARVSAFVRDRNMFVQCRDFFWRDVKPGDTTGQFEAREPMRYREWTDKVTHMRWAVPKDSELALNDVKGQNSCAQGFSLPTEDQLQSASVNGLFQGVKASGGIAFDKAWTQDHIALAGIAKGEIQKVGDAGTAGVYCVASN